MKIKWSTGEDKLIATLYKVTKKEYNNLRKRSLQALRNGDITEEMMRAAYVGDKKIPNMEARIAAYTLYTLQRIASTITADVNQEGTFST